MSWFNRPPSASGGRQSTSHNSASTAPQPSIPPKDLDTSQCIASFPGSEFEGSITNRASSWGAAFRHLMDSNLPVDVLSNRLRYDVDTCKDIARILSILAELETARCKAFQRLSLPSPAALTQQQDKERELSGMLFKANSVGTELSKDLRKRLQIVADYATRLSEIAEKLIEIHKQRVLNAEKRYKSAKEAVEASEKEFKKRQRAHGALKSGLTIKRKRFSFPLQLDSPEKLWKKTVDAEKEIQSKQRQLTEQRTLYENTIQDFVDCVKETELRMSSSMQGFVSFNVSFATKAQDVALQLNSGNLQRLLQLIDRIFINK